MKGLRASLLFNFPYWVYYQALRLEKHICVRGTTENVSLSNPGEKQNGEYIFLKQLQSFHSEYSGCINFFKNKAQIQKSP